MNSLTMTSLKIFSINYVLMLDTWNITQWDDLDEIVIIQKKYHNTLKVRTESPTKKLTIEKL